MADEVSGRKKAKKLIRLLDQQTEHLNIRVLDGDKVVEITDAYINKGEAVSAIMRNKSYDFILCIGDDHTDEFIFKQLPKKAFTIKVGAGKSEASLRLKNFKKTRLLLRQLLQSSRENSTEIHQEDIVEF